jgi:hypothetical protein
VARQQSYKPDAGKKRIDSSNSRTVEYTVTDIHPALRTVSAMCERLGIAGKVYEFKFTTDDKSTALVKLIVDISNDEIATRLPGSADTFMLVSVQAAATPAAQ